MPQGVEIDGDDHIAADLDLVGRVTALEATSVVAGYGELEILHGVSLRVDEGELVAIIGPNGSGKSTLLKTIFGLVPLHSGTVRAAGTDISGLAAETIASRGVSYVPQNDNVFPSMSIHENLLIGGYLTRGSLADRLARVYALFPDLAGRQKARARDLSGGQRQMLAMARALMLDPKVLLLDEPSAGLSPKLVDVLARKIMEINASGTAILLVEQSTQMALTLSSRAYVLATGKNVLEGQSKDILENKEIGTLYLGR